MQSPESRTLRAAAFRSGRPGISSPAIRRPYRSGVLTPEVCFRLLSQPSRHWVDPIVKPRMDECPINKPPLPRIRRNIPELSPKILAVANPMLVESHLPYFPAKLRPHLMRVSALDALRAALNRLTGRRSQQYVQMFRHHNEPMQRVPPLIPIMKERLYEQLGIRCPGEKRTPLKRRGRERIGFHFEETYLRRYIHVRDDGRPTWKIFLTIQAPFAVLGRSGGRPGISSPALEHPNRSRVLTPEVCFSNAS
jgi:hypothetical protein